MTSLAPNPVAFSQIQMGLLLTATGSKFYSNSAMVWNGAVLPTAVVNGTELQATITTTQLAAPGTAQVAVHTPANLSGDLGCDSGGDSKAQTFTAN